MKVTNDYSLLINDCLSYIEQESDKNVKQHYSLELDKCTCVEDLITTGIFHDAIGKFISFTEDKRNIEVEIDY